TLADGAVEEGRVACLGIDVYTALGRSVRAVEIALAYLRRRGIDWATHPTDAEVRHEYERIWSLLGGRAIEQLVDLPPMSEPESVATLDLLVRLAAPAQFTDKKLFTLAACKAITLCLENGTADGVWFACAWLAMFAGPDFGDYQASFRFGRLGYEQVQ